MADSIRRLLDFSRRPATARGRVEDLRLLAGRTLDLVGPMAQRRRLRVERTMPASSVDVNVDEAPAERAFVEIRDDGHGIDPEQRERLFEHRHDFGELIGTSRPIERVRRFLDRIVDSDVSVLVTGESGTGKEVVARLLHAREVPFDVRVISTTNRDLETAIDEAHFRQDLYFRVNVVNVDLPPLRSRGGDALLLAHHFLAEAATASGKAVRGIAAAAGERLLAYAWPGNVRELQNCMERAVALARFDEVTLDDLPEAVRNYVGSHVLVAGIDPADMASLEEVERRYVMRVLEAAGGNKALAARILGVGRKTLYRKLERWDAQSADDD